MTKTDTDDTGMAGEEARWYTEHTAIVISTLKWALLGAIAGVCVGIGTRAFLWSLQFASHLLRSHPSAAFRLYWLLPLALPGSVALVRTFAPSAKGHGTEAVISAVHDSHGRIAWKVAPVKLLATVITLAFGGSVGKEGPCAQIGASISSLFADVLRLNNEDRRRLVICGIGAGFAAVFGTPVSGALFGIEVLYLGKIEYAVLFPCLVAGIAAHFVSGVPAPAANVPAGLIAGLKQPQLAGLSAAFGALCGLVALLLIETMRAAERYVKRFERHPYAVATMGGLVLAVFYTVFGDRYAGLGTATIGAALAGSGGIFALAFLWKIVATTVTLETGGSGGIVTPLFFIGAALGSAFAKFFHLPAALFATFGFVAVAAGATNTPIALSVMGMELLPGTEGVYAALCACTAYLLVGHRGVYASQKLAMVKSAGLMIEPDIALGDISHRRIRVREGTITHRVLRRRPRRRAKPTA